MVKQVVIRMDIVSQFQRMAQLSQLVRDLMMGLETYWQIVDMSESTDTMQIKAQQIVRVLLAGIKSAGILTVKQHMTIVERVSVSLRMELC